MLGHESPVISRASGCWLYTTDGRRLFDGAASMWCNVHGHQNPRLDAAISEQLGRVAHVTTLGMCCDVTLQLAEKLVQTCPSELEHIFFSSDGASAVEAAIKMAMQYWRQCDDPQPGKTRYLALGGAYHGDTTGGVSLGGIEYFHSIFSPLLFDPIRGPLPCSLRLPDGVRPESATEHYGGEIEGLLRQHHQSLAAVVMEPLVQGAAGIITHPVGFLAKVRELCDRFDVLLICDEVATGFGRTGEMFACDHESVTPDILCLGKGITGGYLPMAATVATRKVFEAFLGEIGERRQFFHGHTYGGNALAAAVALASLELFAETDLMAHVQSTAARMRERLAPLASIENVVEVRGRGMMVGIEMAVDGLASRVCQNAFRRGIWIRPLGEVVVLTPPLVATTDELDDVVDVLTEAIDEESQK